MNLHSTYCRCGKKWGEHNYDTDILEALVKGNCVVCGEYLGDSLERYIDQGNWCNKCNAKAHRSSMHHRSEDWYNLLNNL